ncbi:MAG: cation:dicarboxylase symporter family transporter, partial [Clostridia bacterium]|nr:cation:dicarboxylase symporter family transporter [Clostridia bacterium]
NIVDPFRTGNTFHIIVIATMIGCALLAVGERGRRVCDLINDFAILFQQIVSSICAWIPVFVFSMLLQMIWSGKIGVLASVLKPLLLNCVLTPILLVSAWLITSFRLKCPPILLLKKVFPAFLVALSTASSMSAFHIGMETCEKKLGVNKNLTAFVYPLGSVLYMPSSVLYFTMIVFLFAETYQIAVSIPWIVMTIIMATLITIAMPPIPGADILCYTALFSSLGIPAEAIVLAAAAGVALDYIDTGTNVTLLIFRIACDAKRLDDLDREILLCE